MTTWLILNSAGLAFVGIVLYLVLRQIGFVLSRVGPPGARGTSDGPRVGENLTHHIPDLRHSSKAKLILFGADACSICARVKKDALQLARAWRADAEIFLFYDCERETDSSPPSRLSEGVFFSRDCELRKRLDVTFVPFAIVTDGAGSVIAKGLVNEGAQLESLLELERTRRHASPDAAGQANVGQGAEA